MVHRQPSPVVGGLCVGGLPGGLRVLSLTVIETIPGSCKVHSSPFIVGGVARVPQGHLVALYSAFGATFEFEASPI